jgi:HlyD family secretion protein
MSSPGLFRQRALERIGSADEFDRLVRVTSPRYWIALTGVLVVVVAAICWACFSTILTTQRGPGFLLPEGGLHAIQAPVAGELSLLNLKQDARITDGQSLGFVRTAAGTQVPIRSSAAGIVTETDAERGTDVTAGEQLGLVQPTGRPTVVYTYLPVETASGIKVGTKARVRFAGGIGATYGDAIGKVQSVSRFATTRARLEFVLHGSAVKAQPQLNVPTSELVIKLDRSSKTPSGLVWASGHGPPTVAVGTPAAVELILGSRHPIDDLF